MLERVKRLRNRLPIILVFGLDLLLFASAATALALVFASAIYVFYSALLLSSPERRNQFRIAFLDGAVKTYLMTLVIVTLGSVGTTAAELRRRRDDRDLSRFELFLVLLIDAISGHGRPQD
jgi:hypothetical protein